MGSPYIGEIRMFAGNFAPNGWAFCQGQTMAISENDALFNLIGTFYGGDGVTTFNLPNLSSRVPLHAGSGFVLAQAAGAETVTLTVSQLPVHNHTPVGSSAASGNSDPTNSFWASNPATKQYVPAANGPNTTMAATTSSAGGSQPHDNMLPFLCVNFIISLFGIYPTPS